MDAKSRASFINSFGAGQNIPCPKCGKPNTSDCLYCVYCGSAMKAAPSSNNAPAFTPVKETPAAVVAQQEEHTSAFAEGLPAWDIVPPQVLVRRH